MGRKSGEGANEQESTTDGMDGLLIPPGDALAWRAAMQRQVNEPDLLACRRANTRPLTTLDEHTGQIQALYAALIQGKHQA